MTEEQRKRIREWKRKARKLRPEVHRESYRYFENLTEEGHARHNWMATQYAKKCDNRKAICRKLEESFGMSEITKEITDRIEKKEIRENNLEVAKVMIGTIRDRLFEKDPISGETWYEQYLRKYMNEALADPNSKAGQSLASGLINEKMFYEMDRIAREEQDKDIDFKEYRIRKTLYDKQQEVFDNNIDRVILIINSRRSGKTELMGRILIKHIIKPYNHVAYINRSASAAARQIEGPLMAALKSCGMDVGMRGSVNGGRIDFPNGSWILILGNNNISDVDRLRGEKLSCVVLDEVAHQRNMKHLITEVIQPAMIDYKDSQLIAVGTPPRTAHTYVEELWNNPRVKKYHWTFEDNPFIPNRENVIKEVCELHGISPDSAFIQREYYGRMDAYDTDAMVIKRFDVWENPWIGTGKNNYIYGSKMDGPKQPPKKYDYAWIGVDWGFEDKAAVVGIVANREFRRAWIIDCWSKAKTPIREVAEEVLRMKRSIEELYKPTHAVQVICDTNDKQGIAELYSTYNIKNVFGAWKYDKDLALDQLGDMFVSGVFSIANKAKIEPLECIIDGKMRENPAHAIIDDCEATVWKRDEETDTILHEIDDSHHHPNALMAVLYVSRQFCYDVLGDHLHHKQAKMIALDETYTPRPDGVPEMVPSLFTREEQSVIWGQKEGII